MPDDALHRISDRRFKAVIEAWSAAGNDPELATELQKARFTGSDDVTLVELTGAGHFPMLEERRQEYQQMVGAWLHAHEA